MIGGFQPPNKWMFEICLGDWWHISFVVSYNKSFWRERERERERERPGYLSESVPYTLSFTPVHLLHLHTGNLKEHTYEHNNIDHMLDISGHL